MCRSIVLTSPPDSPRANLKSMTSWVMSCCIELSHVMSLMLVASQLNSSASLIHLSIAFHSPSRLPSARSSTQATTNLMRRQSLVNPSIYVPSDDTDRTGFSLYFQTQQTPPSPVVHHQNVQ